MHCLKCKLFLEHFQWELHYLISALIWEFFFTAISTDFSGNRFYKKNYVSGFFIGNWFNLRYIEVCWTFINWVQSLHQTTCYNNERL